MPARLPQIDFLPRGVRLKGPAWGKTYRSEGGRYKLYCSDRFDGEPQAAVRWLAIVCLPTGGEFVIKRCRSRARAVLACRRHARAKAAKRHAGEAVRRRVG